MGPTNWWQGVTSKTSKSPPHHFAPIVTSHPIFLWRQLKRDRKKTFIVISPSWCWQNKTLLSSSYPRMGQRKSPRELVSMYWRARVLNAHVYAQLHATHNARAQLHPPGHTDWETLARTGACTRNNSTIPLLHGRAVSCWQRVQSVLLWMLCPAE